MTEITEVWRYVFAWATLILYGVIYNQHFGWNAFPQSDAEVICDGIFFLGLLSIYLKA